MSFDRLDAIVEKLDKTVERLDQRVNTLEITMASATTAAAALTSDMEHVQDKMGEIDRTLSQLRAGSLVLFGLGGSLVWILDNLSNIKKLIFP